MPKLTAQHFVKIQSLMLKTTQSYIACFAQEDADSGQLDMYTTDVQHNINALARFNKDRNAQALHNSIMQQDTLVREYYYSVLRYIEDNALIPSNMFCCI